MHIITRKAALAGRLRHYFTGELCRNGHIAERYTVNWHCVECTAESQRRRLNLPKPVAVNREWAETFANTQLRNVWRNMILRCHDPAIAMYPYYGGRGIDVCDE